MGAIKSTLKEIAHLDCLLILLNLKVNYFLLALFCKNHPLSNFEYVVINLTAVKLIECIIKIKSEIDFKDSHVLICFQQMI
ncbi:hypothetical protein STFR1_10651 [Bacillus vallismortis]